MVFRSYYKKSLLKRIMDILRITTAGSVDDGKSTLIGRLLYDTCSITNDKLEAIEVVSKRKGLDFIDLSLLTDGRKVSLLMWPIFISLRRTVSISLLILPDI